MKTKDFTLSLKGLTDEGTFEGYGSIFGNVDSYGERVMPGAFGESLAKHRREGTSVLMLWQHNPHEPIGVWDDLAEDGKGLWGKGRLIMEVQKAREVHALMKAGAIGGLSIGYREIRVEPKDNVRELEELDLREISPVSFPANRRARISAVKSIDECRLSFAKGETPALHVIEDVLRDAGFSRSLAASFVSLGKAALSQSDSGGQSESDLNEAKRVAAFLEKLRG